MNLDTKIPPPFVTAAAIFLCYLSQSWPLSFSFRSQVLWAILISVSAITLMVVAVAHMWRAKTTVNPLNPESASHLLVNGVFGLSRNPIYVADAMLVIAAAVYWATMWGVVWLAGFVLYMNRYQIQTEEKALQDVFGADYANYKNTVRRWI